MCYTYKSDGIIFVELTYVLVLNVLLSTGHVGRVQIEYYNTHVDCEDSLDIYEYATDRLDKTNAIDDYFFECEKYEDDGVMI